MKSPVQYVPDSTPYARDWQPNLMGTIMRANPNTRPGAQQAVRHLDNSLIDSGGTARSADNEVGLTVLDQPLTQYAVGYPGEGNLQQILDALAPVVPAAQSFQYLVLDAKQNWVDLLTNDGDIRAMGSDFLKLPVGMTRADGSVDEKGLTVCIDHRMGGQVPAIRQAQVARLKNILLRTEIRRVFATLDANISAETSENWGTSTDPDASPLSLIDSTGDARGINSNLLVYGGGAWLKRKKAYRRLKAGGSMLDFLTSPEELAADLGVAQVLDINIRRQVAAAKGKVLDNVVYGYYAGGTTAEDPSNIKRFVDVSAGTGMSVFIKEEARYTEITVWHASRIVCTSTLGMFKLPVTYTLS